MSLIVDIRRQARRRFASLLVIAVTAVACQPLVPLAGRWDAAAVRSPMRRFQTDPSNESRAGPNACINLLGDITTSCERTTTPPW